VELASRIRVKTVKVIRDTRFKIERL